MTKSENTAKIKVYFDDGANLTWSIRPGGPAALDRDQLATELIRFAETIRRKPSGRQTPDPQEPC